VTIDPEFMAEQYIEQALINFYKLELPKSARDLEIRGSSESQGPGWQMNVRNVALRSMKLGTIVSPVARRAARKLPICSTRSFERIEPRRQ
jgi:hypothetical protein